MEGLEQIYRKYFKDVYYYLLSLTKNPTIAEDLTSETFLGALKSLPQFKGESSVKTWLFSIAKYQYYSYLRKEKRLVVDSERVEIGLFEDHSEERVLSKELLDLVNTWLEGEEHKEMFLSRVKGLSYEEIGERFLVSPGSARVILYRMRRRLKEYLKEEGYDENQL